MHMLQAPSAVVMIRPHAYMSNPVTRVDTAFQTLSSRSAKATSLAAQDEHDAVAAALRSAGVRGHVFDD